MFRISPTLQGRLPALDETAKAKHLNGRASMVLEGDGKITKVASQLVASSFYFELVKIDDGYGEKFQVKGTTGSTSSCFSVQSNNFNIGQICCRLSERSNEIAGLGEHLQDRTKVERHRPLSVHIGVRNNQGLKEEVAIVDLSEMVNSMAQNKPYSTLVSFELKNKGAPIEMRLQFGKVGSSSCLISGFPRSLMSDLRPRGRTHSRQAISGPSSSAGSPPRDRFVDWKPPERHDGMYTVDIRRYTDPSRKLGYNIGDSKKQESLKSRLFSLILAQGSLDDAAHVANNRMNPIRKVQARE